MIKSPTKYPIRLRLKECLDYESADASRLEKLKRTMNTLSRRINRLLRQEANSQHCLLYSNLAHETGIDQETVKAVLYQLSCGSNGVTVWR
jgi:hypothetical protein